MTAPDRTPAPPLDETDLAELERMIPLLSDLEQISLVNSLRAAWREKRYWLEHYALDINGYLHCRWCGRQYSAFGHTEECPAGRLEEEARTALAAPGAGGRATEESTT